MSNGNILRPDQIDSIINMPQFIDIAVRRDPAHFHRCVETDGAVKRPIKCLQFAHRAFIAKFAVGATIAGFCRGHLTAFDLCVWSAAMPTNKKPNEGRDIAQTKPTLPGKVKEGEREERLAKALRDNLRRRKAAGQDDTKKEE